MKYAHRLSSNKTTAMPRNFIFYDTETEERRGVKFLEHGLRLGVACFSRIQDWDGSHTEEWLTFRDPCDFWDRVDSFCRPKTKTLLYAHNQHFDFFVMGGIDELKARGWRPSSFFVKSGVFMMTWKNGKRKLQVLDSGNIAKVPLASIGKLLGLEKLDVDFSMVDEHDLEVYCHRDVRILKDWLISWWRFVHVHDLGTYRPTLASQSFQAFKHRLNPTTVFIHANLPVIALERESYFGGRTEAWHIGRLRGRPLTLVDINSLYPTVMRANPYPVKLIWTDNNLEADDLLLDRDDCAVIARVELDTDTPAFAIRAHKTIFPIGKFTTALNTPELRLARDRGWITKVHEVACYDAERIFTPYVDFFYGLKCKYKAEGNAIMYKLAKLFLNSLYGKFGQRSCKMERLGTYEGDFSCILSCTDADTMQRFTHYFIGGQEWRAGKEKEAFDAFVAVASHVTAYARMYLWEAIELVGKEHVHYMDTDSLLIDDIGLERIRGRLDPLKLGAWDIEWQGDDVHLKGAKDYRLGDLTKIKGVRRDAVQLDANTFKQIQFQKARSMLRDGHTRGARIREVTKHLTRKYDKGIVTKSGRVRPYSLPADRRLFASAMTRA